MVGPIAGAKVAATARTWPGRSAASACGSMVMMMVKAIGISTPPAKPWRARSTIICSRFRAKAQATEKTRNSTVLASR